MTPFQVWVPTFSPGYAISFLVDMSALNRPIGEKPLAHAYHDQA